MLSITFQNLNHKQIGKRSFIDLIRKFDPEPSLLLTLIICSVPWCRRRYYGYTSFFCCSYGRWSSLFVLMLLRVGWCALMPRLIGEDSRLLSGLQLNKNGDLVSNQFACDELIMYSFNLQTMSWYRWVDFISFQYALFPFCDVWAVMRKTWEKKKRNEWKKWNEVKSKK